jgi:hypothetical protein
VATPYGTNGQAKEEEKFWWEKMAAYTWSQYQTFWW